MTPAQILALHNKVIADPAALALIQARDTPALKDYLNATATPDFVVWRSSTEANVINDAIIWANLTPTDPSDVTVLFTNRVLVCQAKQINLQILLQGQQSINSAKANIRTGLQDALTNIPSGTAGALMSAGWAGATGVKAAMTRLATVAEKLAATGAGTAATPAALSFEGMLSDSDASAISLRDNGSIWST